MLVIVIIWLFVLMTYMLLSITPGTGQTIISAYDYGHRCYKNPSLTRIHYTSTMILFIEAHETSCYDRYDNGNMIALRSFNDGKTWSTPMSLWSKCKHTHSPQSFIYSNHTYIMYVCDNYGIAWRKLGNTTISHEHYQKNLSNGLPIHIHSSGIVNPHTAAVNMPITIGEQFMTLYSDDLVTWKTGARVPMIMSGTFEYSDNKTMLLQTQTIFKFNAIINSYDNGKTWSDIQTVYPFRRNKPAMIKHNDIIYSISTDGLITGSGLTIFIYKISEQIWLHYYTIDTGASYDASVVVMHDGNLMICYEKGWRSSIHCSVVAPYHGLMAPIDV